MQHKCFFFSSFFIIIIIIIVIIADIIIIKNDVVFDDDERKNEMIEYFKIVSITLNRFFLTFYCILHVYLNLLDSVLLHCRKHHASQKLLP